MVVRVRDNGAGIPGDMLPRVFDLFTRVDGTLDRAQGGPGISLSLVKKLVEMHGGTIDRTRLIGRALPDGPSRRRPESPQALKPAAMPEQHELTDAPRRDVPTLHGPSGGEPGVGNASR